MRGPLQPQRLLDSLHSFNFLLCVLHVPHVLKACSDDKRGVKPDKLLAVANWAIPLTGFSLQTYMLPSTAQLFYHPGGRYFITLGVLRGQEDKRQKKGPMQSLGWDIALFNQTSCYNCVYLLDCLLHNFFWTSPTFSCSCPLCARSSLLSLCLMGGALSSLPSHHEECGSHQCVPDKLARTFLLVTIWWAGSY